MTFATPWFLLLLIILFLPRIWRIRRTGTLIYSEGSLVKNAPSSLALRLSWVTSFLRWSALGLIIVALSRPQWIGGLLPITQEGVDIVITLDISGSMRAEDMQPNRAAAAKEVAERFISGRVSDRIGLVAYAGEAYTQCPLTLDHNMLVEILRNLDVGAIKADGTAIGMALAEAGTRLKGSHAKSNVIILITDGVNNTGAIDPKTAAEIIKALGLKAYTIGIGSKEGGRVPMGRDIFGRIVYSQEVMELDEDLLKSIAGTTGGKFFLARDSRTLNGVFSEIDRLEKSEFGRKAPRSYREAYRSLLFPAFVLLFFEIALKTTRMRRFP